MGGLDETLHVKAGWWDDVAFLGEMMNLTEGVSCYGTRTKMNYLEKGNTTEPI